MPGRDGPPAEKTGTGVLSGRVVAAEGGKPLRRALVRAGSQELPQGRSVSTDGDGRWQLKACRPGAIGSCVEGRLRRHRVRPAASVRDRQGAGAGRWPGDGEARRQPAASGGGYRPRLRRIRRAHYRCPHIRDALSICRRPTAPDEHGSGRHDGRYRPVPPAWSLAWRVLRVRADEFRHDVRPVGRPRRIRDHVLPGNRRDHGSPARERRRRAGNGAGELRDELFADRDGERDRGELQRPSDRSRLPESRLQCRRDADDVDRHAIEA